RPVAKPIPLEPPVTKMRLSLNFIQYPIESIVQGIACTVSFYPSYASVSPYEPRSKHAQLQKQH
ncbi:hypothetical protein, partial [uncultured Microbulbifer sp.]|uniref:hypothetical protein n=1 Tax=uncultured Microbulbifer sp. TaxID=348147 RepID=UPI00261027E0